MLAWLCPLAFFRLGFGGDSSSTQKTEQYDQRSLVDASRGGTVAQGTARSASGGGIVSDRVSVSSTTNTTTTDVGTVRNAFDFAKANSTQAYKTSSDALGAVTRAYADAKGGQADTMKYALLAVAGIGIAVALGGRR